MRRSVVFSVAGAALKGPADRLLRELGHEASVVGVARLYAPLAATLVVDVSHVFTTGHGGLYWIRDWWGFYTTAPGVTPAARKPRSARS